MSCCASSRRLRLGRRGSTAVEFGLCGALFLMMMLGGAEAARYWFTVQSLRHAVAEASRAARVDPALSGCDPAKLAGQRPGLGATLRLCVARGASGGMTQVVVTGSVPFRFAVPLFGTRERVLQERAEFLG